SQFAASQVASLATNIHEPDWTRNSRRKSIHKNNTKLEHYPPFLAVDMLIGNVQEFKVLQAVRRGFPAGINGNG
ncbi:MAG: hypothetical protein WBO19_19600, partial [Terriglobia bacterium]